MTHKNLLLVIDGIVNILLGVLLIIFPAQLMAALDLPKVETFFYVNILGGVLFGIGTALLLERYTQNFKARGLGIGGAIIINLFGGGVLVGWLLFGKLNLSTGGGLFLWGIAFVVLGVAVAELVSGTWQEK